MSGKRLSDLILDAKVWMARGVWEPDELFYRVQMDNKYTHYATIRKAIHLAKTEIYA
jgi:hypothetical protein